MFDLLTNVAAYTQYRMDVIADRFVDPDDPMAAEQLRKWRRENDRAERDQLPAGEAETAGRMIVDAIKEGLAEIAICQGIDGKVREKLQREIGRIDSRLDTRHTAAMQALAAGEDVVRAAARGTAPEPST